MTKEELEKEAEEKYSEIDREFIACQDEGEVFNIGYILGAEPREKRIAELEEENAELKDDNKVMADNYSKMEQKFYDNLTKAKKIIKKFSEFVNNDVEYEPEHPQEYTDLWNKLCKEAEQFIKDSEVEK